MESLTDRPSLAARLAHAVRELSAIAAIVDVAMISADRATVTLISTKAHPDRDLTRARALAARARVWPVLKRVRGL